MAKFTRAWRLWELLFPGAQQVPGEILTYVQPTYDVLSPRVGECLMDAKEVTAVAGAGTNTLTLLTPGIGRIHIPISLVFLSDTAIAAMTMQVATVFDASSPEDRWGGWNHSAGSVRYIGSIQPTSIAGVAGTLSANVPQRFPHKIPPVVRGSALTCYFTACAGAENLKVHMTYFDCPGEIIQFHFTP